MSEISERIRNIAKPGIHDIMSRTRAMIASGADVISLGQAVPDILPPARIHEAVKAKCTEAQYNMYSPDPGLDELRNLLAAKLRVSNNINARPSEILITPGANGAYAAAIPAITQPGSEVILPSPVYMNHKMAIEIAGAIPIEVPTDESKNYALDVDAIEEFVTNRTVAITIVSPNNPTGAVYPASDLKAVAKIAKKYDLWLISDEVYEHINHSRQQHVSIGSFDSARDRTITIGSFSKSHAMTGWRCGWLAAPQELADEILKIHDTFFICAPVISQLAAIEALKMGTGFLEPYIAELKNRKKALREVIEMISCLTWHEPDGALFSFVRYDLPVNPHELACDILEKARVAVIPGTAFGRYGSKHLRISFGATTVNRIFEAGERLSEYFDNLR